MGCEYMVRTRLRNGATVKGQPVDVIRLMECGSSPTAIWPDIHNKPVELCRWHLRWAIHWRMVRLGLICELPPPERVRRAMARRSAEFEAGVWRGAVDREPMRREPQWHARAAYPTPILQAVAPDDAPSTTPEVSSPAKTGDVPPSSD